MVSFLQKCQASGSRGLAFLCSCPLGIQIWHWLGDATPDKLLKNFGQILYLPWKVYVTSCQNATTNLVSKESDKI